MQLQNRRYTKRNDMLSEVFFSSFFPPVHLDSTDVCTAKNYVPFPSEAKRSRHFRFILLLCGL